MCASCGDSSHPVSYDRGRVHLLVVQSPPDAPLREPVTIGYPEIARDAREALQGDLFTSRPVPEYYAKPNTRADCLAGGMNEVRPCPFVTCRHHLGLEETSDGGIRIAYPDGDGGVDIDSMAWTCAIDAAEDHEWTLEEVASAMRYVSERIYQIEFHASEKLKRRLGNLRGTDFQSAEGESE